MQKTPKIKGDHQYSLHQEYIDLISVFVGNICKLTYFSIALIRVVFVPPFLSLSPALYMLAFFF